MMDERIEKLLKAAPPLREEDLTKINALYPAYLFRRRRTREIWTSCCGRKERLSEYSGLMYEEHQPEITKKMRYYGGCGGFYPSSAPRVQEKVRCPYCGKEAVLKEVGWCGNGDNLFSFRRVIVLRWYREALWAMGYNTEKGYDPQMERLTGKPAARLTHIWRFTPGRVQYAERDWRYAYANWRGYREIDTTHLKSGWKCPEGFPYCAKWGKSYDMICTDELDKSPWRYCNQHHYLDTANGYAMRFLALCTGYPMQVEMLLKAGLTEIVDDMVVKGKLNAKVLNWNQSNVLQSFGVPKDVLQDWLISGGNLKLLTAWKALNKEKIHAELQDLNVLYAMRPQQFEKTAENMKRHGVSGKKMLNYLQKEYEASEKRYNVQELWNDYIYAAERIGYDMKNPVFLLPRDLSKAHDKATGAYAALKKDIKNAEYRENRLQKLTKKYTFWSDRWLIRPPATAEEIVNEGKALKHCVGGYADRHIKGWVTILFLRDRQKPGRPLVTIEMDKNRIVQIHGWDDERTACPENPNKISPKTIYKEFLNGWLDWLEAGSKRKKGYPVMMKEEKSA